MLIPDTATSLMLIRPIFKKSSGFGNRDPIGKTVLIGAGCRLIPRFSCAEACIKGMGISISGWALPRIMN
jgi:hypothetical protein